MKAPESEIGFGKAAGPFAPVFRIHGKRGRRRFQDHEKVYKHTEKVDASGKKLMTW
jgi:hypothetical protein